MAIRLAILIEPGSPHVSNYVEAAAVARGVSQVAITGKAANAVSFGSVPELLEKFKPDLAVVSMPAYRTPPVVAQALEANCHVIAEKPACVRVADFAALVRMADSKHRNLMLAVANRSMPMIQMARTLVADGVIGRPYAAHAMLVADQTRLKSPSYAQSWVAKKDQAMGGFLSWLAIHYLDKLQFLTRDRFTEVTAMTRNANRLAMDVEDSVVVNAAMSGGLIATLHGGYYLHQGYQSGFQLWGSDGWLRMTPHGMGTRTLEWFRYRTGRTESQTWADDSGAYHRFVQSAIDAAVNGTAGLITSGEGLHLLQTVEAAYRAAAEGRTQKIG
ncbi:MAG: Gfo/Idh/MocA family oxidoreductase [Bryobacteraceae bacterium]|nr:Gfo/Idh/MocA family oxidoreductase [Bryobacteraceae bacterium]